MTLKKTTPNRVSLQIGCLIHDTFENIHHSKEIHSDSYLGFVGRFVQLYFYAMH